MFWRSKSGCSTVYAGRETCFYAAYLPSLQEARYLLQRSHLTLTYLCKLFTCSKASLCLYLIYVCRKVLCFSHNSIYLSLY